jgi:excisionase family DNA binding protein
MQTTISRGLTIREFAEINGVSESLVRRGVGDGSIPSYKVGGARRIPADFLARLQRCERVSS